MSTELIEDLIINYAHNKKERSKNTEHYLDISGTSLPSRQIGIAKITKIDKWIKSLIDIKNGRLDLSNTAKKLA